MLGGEAPCLHYGLVEQPTLAAVRRYPITQVVGLQCYPGLVGFGLEAGCVKGINDHQQASCERIQCRGARLPPVALWQAGNKIRRHGLCPPGASVVGGHQVAGAKVGAGWLEINGVIAAGPVGGKAPAHHSQRRRRIRLLRGGGFESHLGREERKAEGNRDWRVHREMSLLRWRAATE